MKPFLRWAGGKQNLVNDLIRYLPSENFVNRYFEPFLGAGSMFFATNYNKCYLSDINKDLINTYKAIKKQPINIAVRLKKHNKYFQNDIKYYYKVRDKFNSDLESNTIKQAARFIFLIHSSFNGIYRVNKQGKYNVPVGKLNPSLPDEKKLTTISEKLKGNYLSSKSYGKIISYVKQNDFIYLDPPYPPLNGTAYFQHYTKDKFPIKSQKEVALFAKKLDAIGCYVMISNADTKKIRDIYKGWNLIQLEATRFVSCKKKRIKINELVITNY
jgi:DNA adenine methylase